MRRTRNNLLMVIVLTVTFLVLSVMWTLFVILNAKP